MIENIMTFRIRYSETDQMGYAHHGNYAQYFEMGRLELMRTIGVSYKKMEEDGLILPVHSIDTRFFKPAKFDDLVTLKTKLKKTPSVRIEFEYEITNENKELITTGNTTLVFFDTTKNRPVKIPQQLLEKFVK
ncbi:acyl-CoA thioesterase [Flavicella sediminum]|uniref:acyl-CoA thioesterase n=1 Tax=Flavicella sediminum TaxID=2585141 RepID=UPI0011221DA6|nr:thioesterase family protein [Flavicella sediminum]